MRRGVLSAIAVAIAVAAVICADGLRTRFALHAVEQDLNAIYGRARPFLFRWPGAEYNPNLPAFSLENQDRALDSVIVQLDDLRPRIGETRGYLRLSARLCLLRGDYDRAIAQYRRALSVAEIDVELQSELASAYALRAENSRGLRKDNGKHPIDYAPALKYTAAVISKLNASSIIAFNAAALYEQMSLQQLALKEWDKSAALETDPAWRLEEQAHARQLREAISSRTARISRLTDPANLDVGDWDAPGALELMQQAAIEKWLAAPVLADSKLDLIEKRFSTRNDLWWRDFLRSPSSLQARILLSQAAAANVAGKNAQAEVAAAQAEIAYVKLGNPAGRLRARWERIVASHRGDHTETCPALLEGFSAETKKRSYRWLEAQGWLDAITCRNLLREGVSLSDRRTALAKIQGLGFEGLTLRALAFLTEPDVSSESPMTVWRDSLDGISRYWASVLPAYRLHHFCWSLAKTAQITGQYEAAVFAFQESSLNLSPQAGEIGRAHV